MEAELYSQHEDRDRRFSVLLALLLHLFLFFILLLPFLRFPIPPPGQEGILVSFGELDNGGEESPEEKEIEETPSPAKKLPEENSIPPKSNSKADIKSETVSEEESPVTADKNVKTEEKNKEKSKEEILQEKEAKEKAKKAQEEADKKAEYEKAKEEFGDLFGEGSGQQPGKQGDPKGDPDSKILEGISKGSGRVGGGLSNRGILFEPKIQDNSQKEGKVVIRICVDQHGKVISSKFTQLGSTTTDAQLVKIALEGSKDYIFSTSEIEEQCGTITVDFKLI